MKLTEQHLDEDTINGWLDYLSQFCQCVDCRAEMNYAFTLALLELKQRRADDRQHDFLSQALNEGDGVYRP